MSDDDGDFTMDGDDDEYDLVSYLTAVLKESVV
jgi:hypothetical protein